MTMAMSILETLEARGLDVELAARMGLDSVQRDGEDVLIIPFMRDGRIVRRKYRRFGEDAEVSGHKWSADKGAERIVWNEDCLRDPELMGQALVITEGELDALAAIQCGFARTISVPDGAPPPGARDERELQQSAKYSWVEALRPLLGRESVPEIVIASDGDECGAALLHDLSVLLGRFRCKFLVYPKARDPGEWDRERLKDLNEVLRDYGARGVTETIRRASWVKVDGVFSMSELPPLPEARIYDIGFPLLSDHYKMRLGDFVVITGVPGYGKTTVVNDIVCRVVDRYGIKVAWASFEQAPQRDHRRNLRAWYLGSHEDLTWPNGDEQADNWIEENHAFIVPNEDEDVTLDWMLDRMEVAVVQHGCQIVVIDPWNEMDHLREPNETITEYVGRSIKALKRFARKFQVHLIVTAHPTKSTKDQDGKYRMPNLYDISDSAHWNNKCDLGIIVHRITRETTLVKVQKSRYHDQIGRPGEVAMAYRYDGRRFDELERLGE